MNDSNPTHCLVTMGRVRTPGAPSLLLVDIQTADVHVLRLPASLGPVSMASGVAANGRHIFLVVQILDHAEAYFYGGSYVLLALERADLSLAGLHPLDRSRDVHTICLHGETLYVVSTGTDEVLSLQMRGPEVAATSVLWRPEPDLPAQDAHHLNSIAVWNGDLIVSGFGRRSGALWSTAVDGFIYNISRSERLLSGLCHPHSVTPVGDDLIFCESRRQALRGLRSGLARALGGYTRGVGLAAGRLLVAASRGRKRSKSTGVLESWGSPGGSGGRCGIYQVDPATFAVEAFIDLGAYGDEVHELLPVTGAAQWPVAGEIEWRDASIAGVDIAVERLRLQHQRNSQEYQGVLDALNLEMRTKIEEANRIIVELHQKADEQSAWAVRSAEQVKERDSIIRTLQAQLQEQTNWALASAEQVKTRDSIIQALQAQLQEQTNWALANAEQVKRRDSIIQTLQAQLQEQTNWALASAEQVKRRDSIIQALQARPG
jgi:hypothetical protein